MSLRSWAKDERQPLQYRNHCTGEEQNSRSEQAADFFSMRLAPLVHIHFHSIKFCAVSTRSGKILPHRVWSSTPVCTPLCNSQLMAEAAGVAAWPPIQGTSEGEDSTGARCCCQCWIFNV